MRPQAARALRIIHEARESWSDERVHGAPTPLPQLQPMYFVRLRRKLEEQKRRRAWIREALPVAGFVAIVAIVVALLVHPSGQTALFK